MNSDLLSVLENIEAVKTGHFLLSSGKHSDTYFQMALALQHYDISVEIAESIASFYSGEMIDVVIGPAMGAIVLAYEIARVFEARGIFCERDTATGKMALRRGFEIMPDERVLIVEDVFTTGGSVELVADLVNQHEGEIVGVSTIINRSSSKAPKVRGIPVQSLLRVNAALHEPASCPLCQQKIPLTKPGSNPLVR